MLKNLSELEMIIGQKVCRLTCDFDMPLLSVKEALFQFLKYVGQIEDNAKSKQEEEKQLSESSKEDNQELKDQSNG